MTKQEQKNINALLFEALKLTLARDHPLKTVETDSTPDVPMSQTQTNEKLQQILEKLSEFIQ
ncbi:MAG: hypothetical protein ACTSQQ_05780 [Candidatus Helarchaeota archaeon]